MVLETSPAAIEKPGVDTVQAQSLSSYEPLGAYDLIIHGVQKMKIR